MLPSCAVAGASGEAAGGAGETGMVLAHLLEREQVRSVGGVIEDVRRGLVERHGAGVGLAVRGVALVDLDRLELVLVLGHSRGERAVTGEQRSATDPGASRLARLSQLHY